MRNFILAALAIAAFPAGLKAETPACPAGADAVPAEYSGWQPAASVQSLAAPGEGSAPLLTIGKAADLALHPDGEVAYLSLPKGAGEASSFGGMVTLSVEQFGTYRVALGDFVWVDLVHGGKPAETVKFGHGPDCTPIRKIVDFRLEPGGHVLEVSGSAQPVVRVMVLRVGE